MQAPIVELRAVVAEGVGGGGKLAVIVVTAALEHLPGHLGIAEVLDAQTVEVVAATADRQVFGPPVRLAFEGDAAAVVDPPDAVRAAAHRLGKAGSVGEVAVVPVVLGQHWQGRQVQGQGAAVARLEVEAHMAGIFDGDPGNVGELGAVLQAALAHQQVEGKAHIFGTYRLAIGEGGTRVDFETQPGIVRPALHAPGDQAIDAVRLVE
ncbi:hypothetical protein D3C76_778300 [compost metagenome]